MGKKIFIRASEIENYIYCKRAWWLSLNGPVETTPAMAQGTLKHEKLANALVHYHNYVKIAWAILLIGCIFLLLVAFLLIGKN